MLPGNGEPSTPATSPAVTTYSADFIQLVPYAATVYPTGTGTVTPSPAPQSYSGSSLLFYTARQEATLTAAPSSGQNFYEFNNALFWLPGGLGANPKTFYVPDTGLTVNTTAEFSPDPVYTVNVAPNPFSSNLYIYADGSNGSRMRPRTSLRSTIPDGPPVARTLSALPKLPNIPTVPTAATPSLIGAMAPPPTSIM